MREREGNPVTIETTDAATRPPRAGRPAPGERPVRGERLVGSARCADRTPQRRPHQSDVESEQNHVPIAHFVVFSFQAQFACFARFREGTGRDEVVVVNGFRGDKTAFKV